MSGNPPAPQPELSDEEVIARVRGGETGLYEIIMRRYNQRLYRVARAILRDEGEAEDVMQEAYVRAYEHLREFEGRSSFSTWLTRIAVHEALARARRRSRVQPVIPDEYNDPAPDPERQAFHAEMKRRLEASIDALPESYRSVFVLRELEGLSPAETAACLNISESLVRTRLHRARVVLRRTFPVPAVFTFPAPRCDRVVGAVLRRLGV